MQPLFIFWRAITGLSPAPKTLARAAFLLAQITVEETAQAHRKLPAHALCDYPPRGCRGEPTAPPHSKNPPLGRVQFEFILKTGIFSPRAEPCGFHGRHLPDFQPAPFTVEARQALAPACRAWAAGAAVGARPTPTGARCAARSQLLPRPVQPVACRRQSLEHVGRVCRSNAACAPCPTVSGACRRCGRCQAAR